MYIVDNLNITTSIKLYGLYVKCMTDLPNTSKKTLQFASTEQPSNVVEHYYHDPILLDGLNIRFSSPPSFGQLSVLMDNQLDTNPLLMEPEVYYTAIPVDDKKKQAARTVAPDPTTLSTVYCDKLKETLPTSTPTYTMPTRLELLSTLPPLDPRCLSLTSSYSDSYYRRFPFFNPTTASYTSLSVEMSHDSLPQKTTSYTTLLPIIHHSSLAHLYPITSTDLSTTRLTTLRPQAIAQAPVFPVMLPGIPLITSFTCQTTSNYEPSTLQESTVDTNKKKERPSL